jgi:bla regulator protein blaR1
MARHIGQGLTPGRKLLLGGAAALAIGIPLALGMTSASKGGIQSAEASNGRRPWFMTASIKLNDVPAAEVGASGNKFVAIEPAIDMIMFAYGGKYPLKRVQVLGGPDWMKTDVFSVDAELPKSLLDQIKPPFSSVGEPPMYLGGVPRTDAVKKVFRALLINRFKLQITHETRVRPIYELVLAKNGPKIAEDKTADQSCRIGDVGPDLPSVFVRGKGRWLEVKCDFRTFAGALSAMPELRSRVLVDKTGLHGGYSFKFHWTPEMPPGTPKAAGGAQPNQSAAASKSSGPSLFAALREQLGLKVQSTTAPVDIIVIQHIENPAKN